MGGGTRRQRSQQGWKQSCRAEGRQRAEGGLQTALGNTPSEGPERAVRTSLRRTPLTLPTCLVALYSQPAAQARSS